VQFLSTSSQNSSLGGAVPIGAGVGVVGVPFGAGVTGADGVVGVPFGAGVTGAVVAGAGVVSVDQLVQA
jgi:hypothetical protein